jgi:hypothetical protein
MPVAASAAAGARTLRCCAAARARVEPRVHADVAARQPLATSLTALPEDAEMEEAERLVFNLKIGWEDSGLDARLER